MKKRVPVKRSKKTGKTSQKTGPAGGGMSRELLGLGFLAFSLITLIALISHFAVPGGKNLLGPFFGTLYALQLIRWLGSLPAILFVAFTAAIGVRLLQREEAFGLKAPVLMGVFFVLGSVLLSVRNIDQTNLSFADFESTGGLLGNFAVQQALVPVFGRNPFGPYFLGGLIGAFAVIWGLKLRLAQIMEKLVVMAGIFVFPVMDAWEILRALRLKRKKALRQRILGPATNATHAVAVQPSTPPPPEVLEAPNPLADAPKAIRDSAPTQIESGPEVVTDPLEIRKMRERERELRRVAELNEWELREKKLSIGGLLARTGLPLEAGEDAAINSPTAVDSLVPRPEPVLSKHADVATDRSLPGRVVPKKKIVKYDKYQVPIIDDVLDDPPEQSVEYSQDFLKQQARLLEEQLEHFKVIGKVVGICPGPVIIRYELELAPGVKVSQISNLSDDLALALKAKSLRILAPIPGKSAIGIEVPNRRPQIVFIKDILKSPLFNPEPDTLKLALGKQIGGEPCVMDLTRAPHLLIAGQTGSGKSVCINSFMASLLCSKTPDEVRLILVDPKVVELKPYNSIPHLLAPVVTQPDVAVQALKWATVEMDKRYDLLALAGVRNIKSFNHKYRDGGLADRLESQDDKPLPYIIIIIDELADLMMVSGKEVETHIARIAQKARAIGIHLILATQRPSTNVLTGTIKANLPTRVAFQVASQIDARTIMDKAGCEKLLGKGDMLFRSIDSPDPERIHGAFVTDDEAESLAEACASQFVDYPQVPTFEVEGTELGAQEGDIPRDGKFRDAAEMVVSLRQASTSLLQRRMSIGYARAGRLMDQLERAGIVGRDRGSKPREVFMDELELQSFLSSGLND